MPVFRKKEEIYEKCISEGNIKQRESVDLGKVKSQIKIAEEDLESAKDILLKKRWNSAYKIFYDVLHGLVESYLSFDRIKATNHQCLFAYLCEKHPELELDWNFFEKIRTKRNGINYYGTPVSEKDWKETEVQMNLYAMLIKKAIKNKLEEKPIMKGE